MKTAGEQAWKQPLLNDSVIAHQPRFFSAENVQRLKEIAEFTDYFLIMVVERFVCQ